MHINEFADYCTFSEVAIGGTLPATEEYRDILKKLHPKQILNLRLCIPLYVIRYGYVTKRGNYRTGEKYYFSLAGEYDDLDMEIEMRLEDWVSEENHAKPYRAISNVQILGVERVAYATLTL